MFQDTDSRGKTVHSVGLHSCQEEGTDEGCKGKRKYKANEGLAENKEEINI
jgi:hypothetical protein